MTSLRMHANPVQYLSLPQINNYIIREPGNSKTSQPHDHLVKRVLSNPATAKDILDIYLPQDVLEVIDLNNLSLQRDSFIDDEHRAFAVDLLYKTTFQKEEGYLWILIEHQRKTDPWLPVRIFKYMAIIWDHLRKISKTHKIPLIYPLVIYNGSSPYSSSLNLKDLIEPEASKNLFEQFFKTPFCLIDLSVVKDDDLRENLQANFKGIALLMTLKHVLDKNLESYFEQTLVAAYQKLDQSGNRDEVVDLLSYLVNKSECLNKKRFLNIICQELDPDIGDKVMTLAQEWKNEGKIEGIIEGNREGRLKEKLETAQRLLADGVEIAFIAKYTGLSQKMLEELQLDSTHVS